ncbi:MAG: hypothetical protein IK132_11910 [Clostridia bacterium]|nr:hypothetical protein [Clostridia bacterium]
MKRLSAVLPFLVLLALLLLLSLTGCRKTDDVPPEEIPTETVYASAAMACPDDIRINYFIRPAADDDAVYAAGQQTTADVNTPVLLRFSRDGSLTDVVPIPLPEGAWLNIGTFTDGRLVFLYTTAQYSTVLAEMPLATADPTRTDLCSFDDLPPEERSFSANLLARDAEGRVFLFGYTGVMILVPDPDGEFVCRGVTSLPAIPSSVARLPDGQVWACFPSPGESKIARIDPESGNLAESFAVDAGTKTLAPSGEDFAVCDCPDGLYSLAFDEDGGLVTKPLLDSVAAGYATVQDRDLPTLHPSALGKGESLFFGDAGRNAAGERGFLFVTREDGDTLTLCTPREVPVTNRREFLLAHAHPLSDADRTLLVRFGRENPDIRLTRLDYSEYATTEDPDAGSRRLTTDILTGLIRPDLLIGNADAMTGDGVFAVLGRKGFYLPLDPYFDEGIHRGTLFDAIQTAFSDADGRMWAIAPSFTVKVLRAKNASLESLSGRTSWSLDEFLDWAQTAPDDAILFQGCVREDLIRYGDPLVRDFRDFYDTETAVCTFDGPHFVRYLRWLASLPDEKTAVAIRGAMTDVQFYIRQGYAAGKLLLTDESVGGLGSLAAFALSDDETLIAYPGSAEITVGEAYLLPACAASPDLAWRYVRAAILSASVDPSDYLTSALKSAFSETLAPYRGGRIAEGADGLTVPLCPDEDVRESLKRQMTFRYVDLPDGAVDEVLAFFDRAAVPFLEKTPPALLAIIREEISAYLSGVGSAEDCASKIQSRAAIWLAENK